MPTNFSRRLSCVALLMAGLIGSPASAQTTEAVVVNEYDVFVDLPTAFAFVKLPSGWKFVGKLDAEQLRHLPAGTLTSLLPASERATELAGGTKQPLLKRKS